MENYFNNQVLGFGTGLPGTPTKPVIGPLPSAEDEINAVKTALDIGYTVFDTAEKYRDGKSETWLGDGLSGTDRSKLHIVSKVLPVNATTKEQVIKSCEASLSRVRCDYFDTYLLHFRQPFTMPLEPVVEGFLELQHRGLIKNYGTSNFTRMIALLDWAKADAKLGGKMKVNQVHYSITNREIEGPVLDYHNKNNIATMAHSIINPLRNDSITTDIRFTSVANKHGYNPYQLAIAWALRNNNMLGLVRSTKPDRIKLNWEAQFIKLTNEVIEELYGIY